MKTPMINLTVADLIKELEQMPQDALVVKPTHVQRSISMINLGTVVVLPCIPESRVSGGPKYFYQPINGWKHPEVERQRVVIIY